MENLEFNEEDFFKDVASRALGEGVVNEEAFDEFVEQAVREHERWGELHDDNDLEGIISRVQDRWPEYEAMLDRQVI